MTKLKIAMTLVVISLASGCPAYADIPPQLATRQLQIAISGHITPKCSLTVPGPTALSFGEILDKKNGSATNAALEVTFTLDCNSPYTAILASRNGGLAFDGPRTANFASLVGYAAQVSISTRAGGMSLTCASAQMRGDINASAEGLCRSHATGFSVGNGKMTLAIRSGGLPLLQGTYSDELVLLVSPDLGG